MAITVFEVYTYFGRIISRHVCKHEEETHHRALEAARKSAEAFQGTSWIRMKGDKL